MPREKLTVCKFGGTSMADARAIKQSAKVAISNNASIVVVSAVSGVTDKLLDLAEISAQSNWSVTSERLEEILQIHLKIAGQLKANDQIIDEIKQRIVDLESLLRASRILGRNDLRLQDAIVSHGELLSSLLISVAINDISSNQIEWLDARKIITTDETHARAIPDPAAIKKKTNKFLKLKPVRQIYVTQGFIGSSKSGHTTTLGRGGSDYSAALFAEAVNADEIQIWTDVSGVASIDPRISEKARQISRISYQEAAEMATSGAKILHPPTMIPARRAGIPILVANTFNPDEGGTFITDEPDAKPLVRAVSLKNDQRLVTLSTPLMSEEYGFLAKIFNVFARHKISVDQVTTSEVSVAITMDEVLMKNDSLFKELSEIADIAIDDDLAVVTLIGNRVNHTPGIFRDITDALNSGKNSLNIRAVFQGASKHSVAIMVDKKHGPKSAEKLHEKFINRKDSLAAKTPPKKDNLRIKL